MKYLTACVIARDEAPYLQEWIDFHVIQGIEHFYFYENGSTDDTLDILKTYEALGTVTIHETPEYPIQFKAYEHFIDNYRKDSEWTAFIDVDEFLYAYDKDLRTFLKDLVGEDDNDSIGGLAVKWKLFGSNGQDYIEPGMVIERFTKRAAKLDQHCKSIMRNKYLLGVGRNPHSFPTTGRNRPVVDEYGQELPFEYAISDYGSADKIAINHYHTKSKEEYFKRKTLPDSGSGEIRSDAWKEEMFKLHNTNQVEDTYLRDKFATHLKMCRW